MTDLDVEFIIELGGFINGSDVECAECGFYVIDVDAGEEAAVDALREHDRQVHDTCFVFTFQ